jgi:hypothetical protein
MSTGNKVTMADQLKGPTAWLKCDVLEPDLLKSFLQLCKSSSKTIFVACENAAPCSFYIIV